MTVGRYLLLFYLLLGRLGSQLAQAQQVMPRLLSQFSKPPAINQTNDSMVEDEQGRLWLATDNGIVCFDGGRFQVYHDPELKQGDSYYHVVLSPDGRIWCKPNGGNFLSYIDSRQPRPRIVRVPANSLLIQKYLAVVGYNYVFADADANLWIGQQGGLLKVNSRTFAVEPVFQEGGQIVNWVTQDRQGVIWFATFQGVNAYNPRSRQLTRYERDPQHPATSLGYDRAFSVHALDNGTILVGLNNEIDVITPTTRTVRRLPLPRTTRFPLVPVHEFYNDGLGNAYFRTRLGVAYRYTVRGEVERLEFGMPTQTVQLLCPGRGNRLWVDWQQSLASYDLTQVRFVRRLELLEIEVNGTRLDESSADPRLVHDTLGLPTLTIWDTDSLRLRVSPQAGVQTGLFRYRLAGNDRTGGLPAWQVTKGVDATVGYQPKAGTYTFELSQPSTPGGWAKPVSTLTLIVKPPFWRTGWFWALVLAITGGVGGGLLQSWNRRRKFRQELDRQTFEAATLREMDEMKTRFFANITHEFRTPLTIILNATEQLASAALNPPEQKRVASVQRNAYQLLRLVHETLDMAKLDAGKLDRREHLGDPVEFVQQVVAQFRGLADQKQVGLEWVVDSEAGAPESGLYLFDDDKVEKITYNLLANALKFTPAGGQVRVEGSITTNHRFTLRVADTGIGIAPDELPRIFERFHQVDSSSTRAYSGTGIGLALVKELTDWLGGTVAVASTAGTGSIFTVELPLTPCTTPEPPDAVIQSTLMEDVLTGAVWANSVPGYQSVAAPSKEDNRPLVLVVEDNDELRAYVVESLSTDYRVVTAENGRRGLEQAVAEVPDLIVSDVMMPKMDGYELVERLKADHRTSHIPVVLLTAKSSYDSRMKGLGAGADDYVSKPFSLAELGLRISNCLRTRQNWQRRLTADSISADAEPSPSPDPRLKKEAEFLNRLRELILNHLTDEPVDVDWLATQANMSRTQLHRKLTALTTMSTTRFVHSVRLEKAVGLLQTGELNIAQVAQAVGYNSQSYFTKVFQEHFGYLPNSLKV